MVKKLLGTLARYGYKAGVHPVPKETNQYRDFRYMVVTDNETWGSSTRKEADELWKGLQVTESKLKRFEDFVLTEAKRGPGTFEGTVIELLQLARRNQGQIIWYSGRMPVMDTQIAVNPKGEITKLAPNGKDIDYIGHASGGLYEAFIAPRKLGDFTKLGWKLGVHARPEQGGKPMYPDFNFFVVAPGESWGTVTKKEADELSKRLNEDAPAMAAGNGGVAGLGVGPQGEPGGKKKKRKGPDGTFAGADVFETDMDALHKSRFGKNRYHRYSRYVGEDERGEDIRVHGRTTKNDIVLKDSRTGAMTYLRKKQK